MFSLFSGGRVNPIPRVRPSEFSFKIFGKDSDDEILTSDAMIGPTNSKESPKKQKIKNNTLAGELRVATPGNTHSIISITSSPSTSTLSLISSSENFWINFNIADSIFESSGGCILITTIPGKVVDGDKNILTKSLSWVNKTRSLSHANENSSEFFKPLDGYTISIPFSERNLTSLASTFSSARNLMEWDNSFTRKPLNSKTQSSFNVFSSQRRITLQNVLYTFSCCEHFQDLPDHYSSSFESGFSMADLSIGNDVFVNFNSHSIKTDEEIFKDLDEDSNVHWSLIVSIEYIGEEHVYDVEIEYTYNFSGNVLSSVKIESPRRGKSQISDEKAVDSGRSLCHKDWKILTWRLEVDCCNMSGGLESSEVR